MTDQPLQPFAPPRALLEYLPDGLIVPSIAMEWFLYAVFAFWAIFTLVAVYHWLKYSHDSWIAFPAIAVHIVISLALMTYALSGNAIWLTRFLP